MMWRKPPPWHVAERPEGAKPRVTCQKHRDAGIDGERHSPVLADYLLHPPVKQIWTSSVCSASQEIDAECRTLSGFGEGSAGLECKLSSLAEGFCHLIRLSATDHTTDPMVSSAPITGSTSDA